MWMSVLWKSCLFTLGQFIRICIVQGVFRAVDITVDYLIGLCDKKVYINLCPILNGYKVVIAWSVEQKVRIAENMWNKTIKNTLLDKLNV
jgi:hypothetical protein